MRSIPSHVSSYTRRQIELLREGWRDALEHRPIKFKRDVDGKLVSGSGKPIDDGVRDLAREYVHGYECGVRERAHAQDSERYAGAYTGLVHAEDCLVHGRDNVPGPSW